MNFDKFIKFAFIAVLDVFLIFLAFLFYFYSSYRHDFSDKKYDCIVVFGASVYKTGEPTSALQKRIEDAAMLYKKGVSNCIVASGWKSSSKYTESEIIKKQLIQLHIPEYDIFLDKKGFDTLQTILNLKKDKSYIFVSSNYHLARIYLLAKLTGIKDFAVYASKSSFFDINHIKHIIREFFAILYNLYEVLFMHRLQLEK